MKFFVRPDGTRVNKDYWNIEQRRIALGMTQMTLCKEAEASVGMYRLLISGKSYESQVCNVDKMNAVLEKYEQTDTSFFAIEWTPEFREFERRRHELGIKQKDLCAMLGVTVQTYRLAGKGCAMSHTGWNPEKDIDELLTKLELKVNSEMALRRKRLKEYHEKERIRRNKMKQLLTSNITVFGECLIKEMGHSGIVRETMQCPGKLETDSQCLLREKCKKCPYLVR